MATNVKVTFDKNAVTARIKVTADYATEIIANEMLKDANYYAREDSGELIRSSIKASEPEKGILRWNTPYAKKAYYVGNASTEQNPNATTMWAHKAAAENKQKYKKMIQDIIKERG